MMQALFGIGFLIIVSVIWLAPATGIAPLWLRLWRLDRRAGNPNLQPGPIAVWGQLHKRDATCDSLWHGPSIWLRSKLFYIHPTDGEGEPANEASNEASSEASSEPPYDTTIHSVPCRFTYGGIVQMDVELESCSVVDAPSRRRQLEPAKVEERNPEYARRHPYSIGRSYYLREEAIPDGSSVLLIGTLEEAGANYRLRGSADRPLLVFVGSRFKYWGRMLLRLGLAALLSLVITLIGLGLLVGELLRRELLE